MSPEELANAIEERWPHNYFQGHVAAHLRRLAALERENTRLREMLRWVAQFTDDLGYHGAARKFREALEATDGA